LETAERDGELACGSSLTQARDATQGKAKATRPSSLETACWNWNHLHQSLEQVKAHSNPFLWDKRNLNPSLSRQSYGSGSKLKERYTYHIVPLTPGVTSECFGLSAFIMTITPLRQDPCADATATARQRHQTQPHQPLWNLDRGSVSRHPATYRLRGRRRWLIQTRRLTEWTTLTSDSLELTARTAPQNIRFFFRFVSFLFFFLTWRACLCGQHAVPGRVQQ